MSQVIRVFKHQGHRTLLAALLFMIMMSPFLVQKEALSWLLSLIMMIILLAAVRTVARRGSSYWVALALGLVALLSQSAEFTSNMAWLETLRYATTALFLFWICWLLLYDIILRSHTVTLGLILGAVNVYLMIGLGFAFVYALIEHLQSGAFTGLEELVQNSDLILSLIYFSFISMSTLGYGDISPLTPHGMTAAYMQAIIGQLYLAILLARLVSLYIGHKTTADK
jgi:hypothetical protein